MTGIQPGRGKLKPVIIRVSCNHRYNPQTDGITSYDRIRCSLYNKSRDKDFPFHLTHKKDEMFLEYVFQYLWAIFRSF